MTTPNLPEQNTTEWSDYNPEKQQLRMEVWSSLKEQGVAIRDPVGHIPNFVGAAEAAERLVELPIWKNARVIKCNPDKPQAPVRLKALEAGKKLYMAVPRLTKSRCFVEVTAETLQQRGIALEAAASMRGALIYGKHVSFEEMEPIDLIIVGCVAVASDGGRTGKGAGFADLELAMLATFGLIQPDTPIVTTVHSLQVVQSNRLPMQSHDWPLNWVVTPEAAIATRTPYPHPTGVDWEEIRPEQYKKIPILRKLREQSSGKTQGR